MKKNILLAGMLGIILVLGLMVTGCDSLTKSKNCAYDEKCQATYGFPGGTTCGASKCAVHNGATGTMGAKVYCNCGN